MANSVDPDQTAAIGAVCSGSTLLASILNSSLMLGNYLQQTISAVDIFRCIFFLGALRVNLGTTKKVWSNNDMVKPVLSGQSKNNKTNIWMANGSLLKVERIADYSLWSILQYFWPASRNNRSWKPFLVFFLSGRLRQVLLYVQRITIKCLENW